MTIDDNKLLDYLYDALDEAEGGELQTALETDAHLASEFRALQRIRARAEALRRDEPSEEVIARVLQMAEEHAALTRAAGRPVMRASEAGALQSGDGRVERWPTSMVLWVRRHWGISGGLAVGATALIALMLRPADLVTVKLESQRATETSSPSTVEALDGPTPDRRANQGSPEPPPPNAGLKIRDGERSSTGQKTARAPSLQKRARYEAPGPARDNLLQGHPAPQRPTALPTTARRGSNQRPGRHESRRVAAEGRPMGAVAESAASAESAMSNDTVGDGRGARDEILLGQASEAVAQNDCMRALRLYSAVWKARAALRPRVEREVTRCRATLEKHRDAFQELYRAAARD